MERQGRCEMADERVIAEKKTCQCSCVERAVFDVQRTLRSSPFVAFSAFNIKAGINVSLFLFVCFLTVSGLAFVAHEARNLCCC